MMYGSFKLTSRCVGQIIEWDCILDSRVNEELMVLCKRLLFKLTKFDQNMPQILIYWWWIAYREYIDDSLCLLH